MGRHLIRAHVNDDLVVSVALGVEHQRERSAGRAEGHPGLGVLILVGGSDPFLPRAEPVDHLPIGQCVEHLTRELVVPNLERLGDVLGDLSGSAHVGVLDALRDSVGLRVGLQPREQQELAGESAPRWPRHGLVGELLQRDEPAQLGRAMELHGQTELASSVQSSAETTGLPGEPRDHDLQSLEGWGSELHETVEVSVMPRLRDAGAILAARARLGEHHLHAAKATDVQLPQHPSPAATQADELLPAAEHPIHRGARHLPGELHLRQRDKVHALAELGGLLDAGTRCSCEPGLAGLHTPGTGAVAAPGMGDAPRPRVVAPDVQRPAVGHALRPVLAGPGAESVNPGDGLAAPQCVSVRRELGQVETETAEGVPVRAPPGQQVEAHGDDGVPCGLGGWWLRARSFRRPSAALARMSRKQGPGPPIATVLSRGVEGSRFGACRATMAPRSGPPGRAGGLPAGASGAAGGVTGGTPAGQTGRAPAAHSWSR